MPDTDHSTLLFKAYMCFLMEAHHIFSSCSSNAHIHLFPTLNNFKYQCILIFCMISKLTMFNFFSDFISSVMQNNACARFQRERRFWWEKKRLGFLISHRINTINNQIKHLFCKCSVVQYYNIISLSSLHHSMQRVLKT